MSRKPVIVVTDGDQTAYKALKEASRVLDLYLLRESRGNPTPLTGRHLVDRVLKAPNEPVVVMVDDRGQSATGPGERALEVLLNAPEVRVLGVVAVAANTRPVDGVRIDSSVTRRARIVQDAVDKKGKRQSSPMLYGDTVDVLDDDQGKIPIIGLGDPGKMQGLDSIEQGVPATRRALQEILARSGYNAG